MIVPILQCGGCFAPVKKGQTKCDFCGNHFAVEWSNTAWKSTSFSTKAIGTQKGVVEEHGVARLVPYADETFEKSFIESFTIKERRYDTRIKIVIYEKDDDLSSADVIDVKKAGLENFANFLRVTSKSELRFADLLKSLNDRYIKIAIEKGIVGSLSPLTWYNRNAHLDNVMDAFHESGIHAVTLYERKKADFDKDGKTCFSFPISHKMQFVADSIFDLSANVFLKAREPWQSKVVDGQVST